MNEPTDEQVAAFAASMAFDLDEARAILVSQPAGRWMTSGEERNSIETQLEERLANNLHKETIYSNERCVHPNQHKSAWQCREQARALLEPADS